MSDSLHAHQLKVAQFVVAAHYAAQVTDREAMNIFRSIRDKDYNIAAYENAVSRIRSILHGYHGKKNQKERVGISVAEVCTLLDIGQRKVQGLRVALGYDAKEPEKARYDYRLVRQFGVRGGGKAGRLVQTLSSGSVIVSTFLGPAEELEEKLRDGATLSLMTVPDLITARWKDPTERDLWTEIHSSMLLLVRERLRG